MPSKLPKAFYNETEAARALSVSPQEFRYLLRQHLGSSEAETDNSPQTTYHASDVLLLKMFVAGRLPVPPPSPVPVPVAAEAETASSNAGNTVAMVEPMLEPQGTL
ncbi:MAG: hypothetical protein FJW31_03610 [Acidobacteria bacterium]|nr:hypothetical protein [Acidobacteriota bacterium]